MELKPTCQNFTDGNKVIVNNSSQHSIKCILDQILTLSSLLSTSSVITSNEQNTLYLSIGDSVTELSNKQSDYINTSTILCRSYFSHSSMPVSDLEYIFDLLTPQSKILIQEINFSEINSFPFNFAVGRFKNLYSNFCISSGFNQNIRTSLPIKLTEAGFSEIERSYLPPIFLKASSRNLINFLFDFISDFILEKNLIIEEERIALSAEISSYLKNENNMISLPGVYQIRATKIS